MSAVYTEIVRRDRHGVLLAYYPDKLGPHHVEQRDRVDLDRQRADLLRAERACRVILIIGEHTLSDIGMRRLVDEVQAIQRALDPKRGALELGPPSFEA
jgi:hypothetical protein